MSHLPQADLSVAHWRPAAGPRTHLFSNGRYAVMLSDTGSGYSRWQDLDITRWREDVTCDSWGSYVFLRDAASGAMWSAGHQPLGIEPDHYELAFPRAWLGSRAATAGSPPPWRWRLRPMATARCGVCRSPMTALSRVRST